MSQLKLAAALTTKMKNLYIGLKDGVADILDCVTPTTATNRRVCASGGCVWF